MPSAETRQASVRDPTPRPPTRSMPARPSALRSSTPRATPFPTITAQTAVRPTRGRTNTRGGVRGSRSSGPGSSSSDSRTTSGLGHSFPNTTAIDTGHSNSDRMALHSVTSPFCPSIGDGASNTPSEDELDCAAPTLLEVLKPPDGPATSLLRVVLRYNAHLPVLTATPHPGTVDSSQDDLRSSTPSSQHEPRHHVPTYHNQSPAGPTPDNEPVHTASPGFNASGVPSTPAVNPNNPPPPHRRRMQSGFLEIAANLDRPDGFRSRQVDPDRSSPRQRH